MNELEKLGYFDILCHLNLIIKKLQGGNVGFLFWNKLIPDFTSVQNPIEMLDLTEDSKPPGEPGFAYNVSKFGNHQHRLATNAGFDRKTNGSFQGLNF